MTRSSCDSLGEGKTSLFAGKERFFPPPSPHLFPEKSEVCCRSVVAAASTAQRAIKNGLSFYTIKLITSELAKRALHVCRMANASHCEAMLHAGFILLFTLICGNANQHQAPTLFQRKAKYVLLPTCPAIALGDGGWSQNLSHSNSRSEHFMFAEWQTLHIAKQCFTQDLSCSSR